MPTPRYLEWTIRFGLLLAVLLLGAALLEFTARQVSPMPPFGPYFDLRPGKKLLLHPHFSGVSTPTRHSANSWGLRGSEPPENWDSSLTILTVGGSTTQCYYLDDSIAWPAQLEKRLQTSCPATWVGNAGLDGHTTRGHIRLLRRMLPKLKPDLILFLVGVNDLALSLDAAQEVESDGDRRFGERLDGNGWPWFLVHSRLCQIALQWKRVLWDRATVVHRINHHPAEFRPFVENTQMSFTGDSLPSLPAFAANVRELIGLCRNRGVLPVFLTQPSRYEDSPHWRGIRGGLFFVARERFPHSAAAEWNLLSRFNRTLLEICREEGIPCLDLGAAIPHDSVHFYDDTHFTDAGSRLVAEKTAEFLEQTVQTQPECDFSR